MTTTALPFKDYLEEKVNKYACRTADTEVCLAARIDQIQPIINARTSLNCVMNTDESKAYSRVIASGRQHKTVCHSKKEFARDEDDDGFCEIHCNSTEGLWTGLRNHLTPFRGVSKKYLAQYVAIFENAFNHKTQWMDVIRAMGTPDYCLQITISP